MNTLLNRFPEIAVEWHPTLNNRGPNDVRPFSHIKAWWQCSHCGHEWPAEIANRTAHHSGCPVCSISNISFPEKAFYFYLSQVFSDIQSNYRGFPHTQLEIDIYLPSIKVGIEYDGSYYHQDVRRDEKKDLILSSYCDVYHIREPKCPTAFQSKHKCFILKNNSMDTLSMMIQEVLLFLNQQYNLSSLAQSKIKELMIDVKKDRLAIRQLLLLKQSEISGSLQEKFPILSSEWDYSKNGDLKPSYILPKSHEIVWWKCSHCGYEWEAMVRNRSNGTGCPKCAKEQKRYIRSLEVIYPELIPFWNSKRNKQQPSKVLANSTKRYWWSNRSQEDVLFSIEKARHYFGLVDDISLQNRLLSLTQFEPK